MSIGMPLDLCGRTFRHAHRDDVVQPCQDPGLAEIVSAPCDHGAIGAECECVPCACGHCSDTGKFLWTVWGARTLQPHAELR